MNCRIRCILLSLTIFSITCSFETITAQEKYFPLHIGNKWTYNYHEVDFYETYSIDSVLTISLIDSVQEYYLFDRYFLYGHFFLFGYKYGASSLFRMEKNRLIRNFNGREMIWYDFSVTQGNSWIIPVKYRILSGDTVDLVATLVSKVDTFAIKQNTLQNCYRFSFSFTKMVPEMAPWEEVFAPNFGLVKMQSKGFINRTLRFKDGIIHNPVVHVSSETEGSKKVPRDFVLSRNYPNPFYWRTLIRYEIKSNIPIFVMLRIYDITGREIRSLTHTLRVSGMHEFIWDGKNDAGHEVKSGTYFYSLFVDGQIQGTNKLVFIK